MSFEMRDAGFEQAQAQPALIEVCLGGCCQTNANSSSLIGLHAASPLDGNTTWRICDRAGFTLRSVVGARAAT